MDIEAVVSGVVVTDVQGVVTGVVGVVISVVTGVRGVVIGVAGVDIGVVVTGVQGVVTGVVEKSGGLLSSFFRRFPKPPHDQADGSSDITEKKTRADETPQVPPRPSEEEIRDSITHRLSVNPTDLDLNQEESGLLSGFSKFSPGQDKNCAEDRHQLQVELIVIKSQFCGFLWLTGDTQWFWMLFVSL
ncbi:apolipoprotein L1 isoform X5 [Tachysurus ichikawai]